MNLSAGILDIIFLLFSSVKEVQQSTESSQSELRTVGLLFVLQTFETSKLVKESAGMTSLLLASRRAVSKEYYTTT